MSIIAPTITMDSLNYFSSLNDHPLQRNTKERQKKAKHLNILKQDHLVVQMIRVTKDFFHNDSKQHIKAGSEYKCNGHTRVLNWQLGECDIRPKNLSIVVFETDNEEEFNSLYEHADNSSAVQNAKDLLYGALSSKGVEIEDDLLKSGAPIGYAANLYDPNKHTSASGYSLKDMNLAADDFYEQYEVFEKVICENTPLEKGSKTKKFKFSPVLITAFLIAMKAHGVTLELLDSEEGQDEEKYILAKKLVNFIIEINKGGKDTTTNYQTAVTRIVDEFDGNPIILERESLNGYPKMNAGNVQRLVSFVLYWTHKHMTDKATNITRMPSEKIWTKFASDYSKEIEKDFAPVYSPNNIIDAVFDKAV